MFKYKGIGKFIKSVQPTPGATKVDTNIHIKMEVFALDGSEQLRENGTLAKGV